MISTICLLHIVKDIKTHPKASLTTRGTSQMCQSNPGTIKTHHPPNVSTSLCMGNKMTPINAPSYQPSGESQSLTRPSSKRDRKSAVAEKTTKEN